MKNSNLKLYKASAGSGKTYTLTREYIGLALSSQGKAKEILAITFTNAATSDMKRKILTTLAQISRREYADMDFLMARTGKNKETIEQLAAYTLKFLLHHYSLFSVKTIDSFVQNTVRPFAFELGLPQDYTASLEIDMLKEDIVKCLIEECGKEGMEEETEILLGFLKYQGEEGHSLRIGEMIKPVIRLIFEEKSIAPLASMADYETSDFKSSISKLREIKRQTEEKIEYWSRKGAGIIQEYNLSVDDFVGGKNGVFKFFSGVKIPIEKTVSPGIRVEKSVEGGILKNLALEKTALGLKECYTALLSINYGRYYLSVQVLRNIYALALVNRAQKILEKIKLSRGIVPISEFNQKIKEALSKESSEFIYERTGERYKHLFIDEFQDTSALQWYNLRPLVENNLAEGNLNLAVGDPKQSIYRFRQADLEQFLDLSESKRTDMLNLQSNWRSDKGIIAFNNLFYKFLKSFLEENDVRQNSTENATGNLDGEDVKEGSSIQRIYQGHEQFYKNEIDRYPSAFPSSVQIAIRNKKEDKQNWYLQNILRLVRQYSFSEVAVLCRTNEQSRKVADILVKNGIKVVSPDSLILKYSRWVRLIVASLRYIYDKTDFSRKETIVQAYILGLLTESDLTLDDYFLESNYTLSYFQSLDTLRDFPIEIYDLVEAVLRIWTIDANVDQYVITFLDAVHLEGGKNIKEVLDWWEKKSEKYAVSTAAPKDAVKVMSIHKAKGLEFQTVIYPYANDKISIYRDLNWIEGEDLKEEIGLPSALVQYTKEMAFTKFSSKMKEEKNKTLVDYLNLLYVATTRACKHLHVLCDESSGNISMDAFSYSDAFNAFVTAYPEYLDKQSLSVNSKENIETKIENLKEVEVDPLQEKQLGIALPSFDWRKRLVPAIEKENIEGAEILWGKFIHEALSCLDGKNDVERAIEKALGKYSRFFLRKEEAKKRIYCVVNDARLKPFFYGDYLAKSETSIYAFSKQFRPDRVMVKGKEAVILDYKTGKELENHLLQMRSYVAALKAMGYEKVQSFLVYIETENLKIKEVD